MGQFVTNYGTNPLLLTVTGRYRINQQVDVTIGLVTERQIRTMRKKKPKTILDIFFRKILTTKPQFSIAPMACALKEGGGLERKRLLELSIRIAKDIVTPALEGYYQ